MLGGLLRRITARIGARSKLQSVDATAVRPPETLAAWVDRGIAQANAGETGGAALAFERALGIDPASIPALHGRAVMHHLAAEYAEAIEVLDRVLAQAPAHLDAWSTRGFAAVALGRLDEALASFRRAVAIEARPGLMSCAAGILFQQGRIEDAMAEIELAIAADPEADFIHSNRLFMLNHDTRIGRAALARAHFDWGRSVEARVASARHAHCNDRDPARRLRIGYVSADLRLHPVAFFIAPVLEHHDHAAVEVFCYDNQSGHGDAFTERLRAFADHWIRVSNLDDDAMTARIRADRIDVLVDLSGHTGGNRLPVFARKPAPVSASWFGYMNTTGLTTIDYRITEAAFCPLGSEPYYSETLFRVPVTAAWSPAPDSPDPGASPLSLNGYVRFGSFNNWAKVSDAAIALWARILLRCPGAILQVVAAGGDTDAVRDTVAARFAGHGIGAARLVIDGVRPLHEFLRLVAGVDIALDPFPYNGGTTTLHTLWMGVPVVSLRTDEEIGRVSSELLDSVGLGDLCARDSDGYVETAVALAGDRGRLAGLRRELRIRMRAGRIMDGAAMAANLEAAYRAMWLNWLEGGRSRTGISARPANGIVN